MDLSKIIHIQGAQGLHKIVVQSETLVIAESLIDKIRLPVTRGHNIINLDMVTVFSIKGEDEGIRLSEIFKAIHEKEATDPVPDKKANDFVLRDYFKTCVPDYDEKQVYVSNIKKVFSWYLILKDTGFSFEDTPEEIEQAAADADASPKED